MRSTILAFTLGATSLLAACSDDTTTGSVDAEAPDAVIVEPVDPNAAAPAPEAPETPVQ